VPVFSSSGLRFSKANQAARNGSLGKITYVETYGPCEIEPHHPDLFWYGVHGVEVLFTVMGPGCQTVQRGTTPTASSKSSALGAAGERASIARTRKASTAWPGARRAKPPPGTFDGYEPLVAAIMKFYQTRVSPVPPKETVGILAFMEAADLSKRRGGAAVKLSEVIKQAETAQR